MGYGVINCGDFVKWEVLWCVFFISKHICLADTFSEFFIKLCFEDNHFPFSDSVLNC